MYAIMYKYRCHILTSDKAGVFKLWPAGQIQPANPSCLAFDLFQIT